MRNALVVLVPLCFGLASGFIVPSGIQEVVNNRKARNLIGPKEKRTNIKMSAVPSPSSSKNAVNGSLNKDLYENSQTKTSDVKTRAFIYIKQNGKKPIRNRLYDAPQKLPEYSDGHKSYLFNMNNIFGELPRQFWIGYVSQNLQDNTNSYKPHLRCHVMEDNKSKKKSDASLESQAHKTFANEQLEFLDLSKAPVLRGKFENVNRVNHDNNNYLTADRQKSYSSYVFNPNDFKTVKADYPKNNGYVKKEGREELNKIEFKNNQNNGNVKIKGPEEVVGPKNNQLSPYGDKSLLEELIKQKLNEHGSLFGCYDCYK